ncbi:MAG: hypothetical protein DHS20C06_04640 [Hyphobacterium sp.]|nr:MAG: hypothetical protein DHS20C06_04640 [Hyphobacterium sp.]
MPGQRAMIIALLLGMVGFLSATTKADAQQDCQSDERNHAFAVTGEAYGGHNFIFNAAPGLQLALHRALWGWRIAVLDENETDLIPHSTMRGGLPEHRDLYGWHFRNSDNSGPNTGEVNAPQHERQFTYRLTGDAQAASGSGWLFMDDFALTDLEPGQQARMMYLRFDACLMRPKTAEEVAAETDFASLDFLPEEEEMMRSCGLGTEYELDTLFRPRMVSGDFDGDGVLDYAAYIRRDTDDARGVAICRAGTALHVLGVEAGTSNSPLNAPFIGMAEAWRVSTFNDVPTGWENEAPRPDMTGDVLVLERIEKEMQSLYWDGTAFQIHQHYRFVEP